jgi:hypothetical protein
VLIHYAKNIFIYDLVIFVLIVLESKLDGWILIIMYIKINYVEQLLKRIEEVVELSVRGQNYLELVNLFCSLLFVAHLFACIWLYVPRYEGENSWIYKFQLAEEPIAY